MSFRYLKGFASYDTIESNLRPEVLPNLAELRRGVVALSRQVCCLVLLDDCGSLTIVSD